MEDLMTTYLKLHTVQDHINAAFDELQEDGTFAAKAHQKEAQSLLSAAYQTIRENNREFAKSLSREDWFSIPHDLFQIREKHMRLFDKSFHEDLTRLVSLRGDFKNIEVVKPQPKNSELDKKQKQVIETVTDMIKRKTAQYHQAVELGRLFGGLPVSVTPHLVTNEYNTTFTRCFYYLNGKFTSLGVILAAAAKLEAEKVGA